MNIQLLSDLHLESNPHFQARPLPNADLLVLAGDIGSYQNGSLLEGLAGEGGNFGLGRFSPLPKGQGGADWPTPVLFVPGNHEYDNLDFASAHERLRATCERLGIFWLERETRVIGAVRFVGTTLWTDFDALDSLLPAGEANNSVEQTARREKAFRAANFYLRKTGTLYKGRPMLAEEVREQGLICQAWLKDALDTPFEGKTVVVTHFAPSLLSADPRYGLTPGTAGFCNALDDRLPKASLWLHGHLHCPVDYVKNGCRVVANPLGYARKNEQEGYRPDLCMSI
ncbi:MAG: metallophosphoesterase [Pseudomonadota bacterium]